MNSIYVKLKKSQSRQTRLKIAHKWAEEWEKEYVQLIIELQREIAAGADPEVLREIFGSLRGLNEPKFRALHNVINELDSPTRGLK